MKPISLPIAELKNALTGLSKVIRRRAILPALATVKIDRTSEGKVALTGSDLERFATITLDQTEKGEPASILVPYADLVATVKRCGKDDVIAVRSDEADGPVKYGFIGYPVNGQPVEHRFESLPPDDFPLPPEIKGEAVPVPAGLRTSIFQAFECASKDETRYVITGAYLDVAKPECHYVVATDGRSLYSSNSFKLPLKESLNLPGDKFIRWKGFAEDGDWQLRVNKKVKENDDPPPFEITSGRWRYTGKQVNGQYPNWPQVVPNADSWISRAELDPEILAKVIKTIECMPCDDGSSFAIGLEIDARKLHLITRAPGAITPVRVPIEARVIGRPVTIFLNRFYLTKALRFGLNTIHVIDAMSPLRFSEGGRQFIVMPVRQAVCMTPPPPTEEATAPEESDSVAFGPDQPAAESSAAQPERTTMPKTSNTTTTPTTPTANGNGANGHESHDPAASKSPLEVALTQIETIKGNHLDAIRGLTELADTLKQVQRDQRASEKEVQSVRTTLEKLQSVKL